MTSMESKREAPWTRHLERVGSREMEDLLEARPHDELLRLRGGPHRALPPHIRDAVMRALDEPDRRPSRGLPELRVALALELRSRSGVEVDPDREILVTNGAMQALNIVCRALLAPDDEVLIPTPTFFLEGVVRLARGVPVYVPCDETRDWGWDIERLEARITPRTKLVFACNPNNPTGFLPSREALQALLDMARRHDLIVLADESYDRFIYADAPFTCALSLRDRADVVLVRSLSKSHGLAGWRVGYISAAPSLVDLFVKVLEWECLHCGYVPQRVATAALQGPKGWLGDVATEYQAIRDRLWPTICASDWLSSTLPAAAPFFFLDVRRVEDASGMDGAEALLAGGIPTVAGRYFRAPGYVRLPFGGDPATIDRLEERLRAFRPPK